MTAARLARGTGPVVAVVAGLAGAVLVVAPPRAAPADLAPPAAPAAAASAPAAGPAYTYRLAGSMTAAADADAIAVDPGLRTVYAVNDRNLPIDPPTVLSFLDPVTRTRTGTLPLRWGAGDLDVDATRHVVYATPGESRAYDAGPPVTGPIVVDGVARRVVATDARPVYGLDAVVDPPRDRLLFGFVTPPSGSVPSGRGFARFSRSTASSTVVPGLGALDGLAIDATHRRLYVPFGRAAVQVRDADTFAVRGTADVSDGDSDTELTDVVADETTETAIAAVGSDVSLVDGRSAAEVARIRTARPVVAVAVDPGTATVYAVGSGLLSVIDENSGRVTATLPLPTDDPRQLAVDTVHHQVYIASFRSPTVLVVDQTVRPTAVQVTAGDGQVAEAGERFRRRLSVAVTGAGLRPAAGVDVRFRVTAGPASFRPATGQPGPAVSTVVVRTGEDGVAVAPELVAGFPSGPVTVTATATGLAPATFALTAGAARAAEVRTVGRDAGQLQTAPPGELLGRPFVATLVDAAGRPVVGGRVAFRARYRVGVFPGNADAAVATTDARGRATSPPVRAQSNDEGAGPVLVYATSGTAVAGAFVLSSISPSLGAADLAVSLTVRPGATGRERTVALTVVNRGATVVADPLVALSVPAGATFTAGTGNLGVDWVPGHVVVADTQLGELAPGARVTAVTGTVTLTGTGPVTLTAAALSTQTDTHPADDVAAVRTG